MNKIIICICFLLFCVGNAWSDFPEMDIPEWLEVTEVSSGMNIMGLSTKTFVFSGEYDVENIVKYYRKKWKNIRLDSMREIYVDPWLIMSREKNKYLYTVQIQEIGKFSARGYLVITDLSEEATETKIIDQIPAMQGSTTINDIHMNDFGKEGRVVLLINSHPIISNHQYYMSYFQGNGWHIDSDSINEESSVQIFRKGRKESHIVIRRQSGKTQVVLNIVEE